jgi:hypothetical protein
MYSIHLHHYHLMEIMIMAYSLSPIASPPNIRPYRVPHKQKDKVDKLTQNMLKEELIRPSNNPYSSLAILVRKKDDSRRICIDYRELNSKTV